jgi:class 3 adenylate cyclase
VLSVAEQAKQPEFIVRALIGITDHYVIIGELESAKEHISEAIAKVSEFNLRSLDDVVNIHLANVDHALGKHEEAIERLRSCYDRFCAENNVRDTVLYGGDLAEWLAEAGRYQEAFEVLTQCSALQKNVYDQEIERTTQLSSLRSKLDVERESIRQRDEARNAVLHSVLPAHIAQRLLLGERKIGERIDSVTILFADVVGFTHLSTTLQPEGLVDLLEDLFTRMDQIAAIYGCERIKTIGDSYMAACGIAELTPDHTERICRMALTFLEKSSALPFSPGQLRIGIHTGPVVAGVMSGSRLSYDVWGDTVNVASRMEANSAPGRILCSADVALVVSDIADFRLQKREPLDIRGKGLMTTYWLEKLSV